MLDSRAWPAARGHPASNHAAVGGTVTFPATPCCHGITNFTSMKTLITSILIVTLGVALVANYINAEAAYAVLAAAGVLAIAVSDYSGRQACQSRLTA
jgi:hypothetical protein